MMKKKSIQFALVLVMVTSALAFTYLNFCSVPVDLRMEAAALQEMENVRQGASLGDIKVIQILLDKLVAVFTTI